MVMNSLTNKPRLSDAEHVWCRRKEPGFDRPLCYITEPLRLWEIRGEGLNTMTVPFSWESMSQSCSTLYSVRFPFKDERYSLCFPLLDGGINNSSNSRARV